MITRRAALLSGTAGLGACALLSPSRPSARLQETWIGNREHTLMAYGSDLELNERSTRLWVYNGWLFPVLRMARGETLIVKLDNALTEHTSIHWHGVRVPNAMDGVPYLTQLPVKPGEGFTYRFVPPDAGTFFFHPHCNTAEQLGRGLVGALIVEEPGERYGDDVVLILKDWRLDEQGNFLPFVTDKGASQAGSFGTLRTVNGRVSPRIDLAARTNVRLRLINADPTRIAEIGLDGGSAQVIAIDGNPVAPFALKTWRLGPGMRLDLLFTGFGVRLVDYFAAEPVVLAELNASGGDGPLVSTPVAALPDFTGARRHTLELGAGVPADAPSPEPVILPDGRRIDLVDSLCLAAGTFWTLDGRSWPGRDHARLPPPLFTLARGEKLVLEIENTTSRAHPIHVHGHTMNVLSASLLQRPAHRADTVLVLPNERVTVGLVAGNPGNWMIHCHVIEHQETGMMGWFRVS
jgi:FtsP/CotA-like multicopper oxidase with cupredoxin domain